MLHEYKHFISRVCLEQAFINIQLLMAFRVMAVTSDLAVPAFFLLAGRKSGMPGNTSHVRDVTVGPRVEPT